MPSEQLKTECDKRNIQIGFNEKSEVIKDLVRKLSQEVYQKENLNDWVWGLKQAMLKKEAEKRDLTGKTNEELQAQLISAMTPLLDEQACDPFKVLAEDRIRNEPSEKVSKLTKIEPSRRKIKLRKGRGLPRTEESQSVSQDTEEKVTYVHDHEGDKDNQSEDESPEE